MATDPRIDRLIEELIDSGATPEEVCRSYPELLTEVRARHRRMGRVRAELRAMFPPGPGPEAPSPPHGENERPPCIKGYEVGEVLGRGGAGVVYRARNVRLGRPVALKMLLAGAYAGPTELARFQREAEAVASLCHANVVQIYEISDHEGRPYFTMELVEGGSLAQKITPSPPVRWSAELVAILADAVAVAHGAGIVHRDLKPANILLTSDGAPKISDFGLARRSEDQDRLTWNGTVVGTPCYMAPEQAGGDAGPVGPAADVYGLGAILYELLTARPPFRGGTALETLRQVLSDDPVPPSRLNPRVPRDLETVCLKCLQKEPQRRYAGAAALAEDLRRYVRGHVVAARPAGRWERAGKWARRNPAVAGLSAVAAFALVTGAVASLLFAFEAARQAGIAKARADQLEQQTGELEQHATELGVQTRAAEEHAKRAREKEEEVTRALLSGLLIPLGRNQPQLTSPLDGAEGEVIRQLRAAPAPVRLRVLDAALSDPDAATRIGRRADWVVHAIVGCDRALRAEVEQRLLRRIRDPKAPQDVVLACARLGLCVNTKDPVWSERSAGAVLVALRDPKTAPDDYPPLAEALVAVSERLPPARAAEHAAQGVEALLPLLDDLDKFSQVYDPLGRAVAALGPRLSASAATRAATALGARIHLPASHTIIWEHLTKALAAVCRQLPPPDAAAHEFRALDAILEICPAAPEARIPYQFRARALFHLCARLDVARGARVADTILIILGSSDAIGPIRSEVIARTGFADVLTAVAERLDAPGSLRRTEELVRLLQKSASPLLPFGQLRTALVALCRRLDAAGATRIAEAIVAAARAPKTSAGVRTILAGALAAVGDQLAPDRRDAVEGALVDSLLADLTAIRSSNYGGVTDQVVAALATVCGRVGAKHAARAAEVLAETIRDPRTQIELLPRLVTVFVATGGRLPPGNTASRVNEITAALTARSLTRTRNAERIVLVEATAATWPGTGSVGSKALAKNARAELEAVLRDPHLSPVDLSRTVEVLAAIYQHLEPADRTAHANALFERHSNAFLAALRNPTAVLYLATVCRFADALMALCAYSDRAEAMRVIDAFLAKLSDPRTHPGQIDFHKDDARKVFARLNEAQLRRVLEHPLAAGRVQRIALDALGEVHQCAFRSTWDYLERIAPHEAATGSQ